MSDLTTLPHQLDAENGTCRAIIETPKGFRNKFDYDPESNLFMLGGLLPEGMMFPFDFGFIPSTLGDDGDPLDILVLMDAPRTSGASWRSGWSASSRRSKPRTGTQRRITGCSASPFIPTITTTSPRSTMSAGSCFHNSKSSSSRTTNNAGRSSRSRARAALKKPSGF